MLYPYISAWVVMVPSVTTETTTTIPVDTCEFFDNSTCEIYVPDNITHTPYVSENHWRLTCINSVSTVELLTSSNYLNLTGLTSAVYNDPVGSTTWYVDISNGGVYEDVLVTNYTISQPYWIEYIACFG